MINLSLDKLKLIAKSREAYIANIYRHILQTFSKPEPKINIEKIRKKFNQSRDIFSKSKVKEIKRNIYEIENKNNLSTPEIKETEKKILKKRIFLNQKIL